MKWKKPLIYGCGGCVMIFGLISIISGIVVAIQALNEPPEPQEPPEPIVGRADTGDPRARLWFRSWRRLHCRNAAQVRRRQ